MIFPWAHLLLSVLGLTTITGGGERDLYLKGRFSGGIGLRACMDGIVEAGRDEVFFEGTALGSLKMKNN